MLAQAQQYPSAFARNLQPGYASAAAASGGAPEQHGFDSGAEQQGFASAPNYGFAPNLQPGSASAAHYGFDSGPEQHGFVDAAIDEVSPDWVHGNYHRGIKPSHLVLVLGSLMLFLAVIMPIWESIRLMLDPTFVYFVGREYCMWVIVLCLSAVLLYCTMIMLLFAFAREEGKTQQNVMGTATTVITVLGLALLLIAQPLKIDSRTAYDELFFRCASAPRSQRLMEYSAVLQTLRNRTECASQVSVEQCEGYQESQPYTGFLKALEGTYKCAGFCWGGAGAAPTSLVPLTANPAGSQADDADSAAEDELGENADGDTPAEGVGLLAERPKSGITLAGALRQLVSEKSQGGSVEPQRASGRTGRRQADGFGNGLMLLATDHALGRTNEDGTDYSAGVLSAASHANSLVGDDEYPPTLFTDANYQTSCDGMAARGLRYKAMEAADMFYYEGVGLVFCAILGMFLQVMNMCTNFSWLTGFAGHGKGIRRASARRPDP